MTGLLECIDLFLLNVQKGQIMLQISFKIPGILVLNIILKGIIPTPLMIVSLICNAEISSVLLSTSILWLRGGQKSSMYVNI